MATFYVVEVGALEPVLRLACLVRSMIFNKITEQPTIFIAYVFSIYTKIDRLA